MPLAFIFVVIGSLMVTRIASEKISDSMNLASFPRWLLRNIIPLICIWASVMIAVIEAGRWIQLKFH